jgi:hypothetical protein
MCTFNVCNRNCTILHLESKIRASSYPPRIHFSTFVLFPLLFHVHVLFRGYINCLPSAFLLSLQHCQKVFLSKKLRTTTSWRLFLLRCARVNKSVFTKSIEDLETCFWASMKGKFGFISSPRLLSLKVGLLFGHVGAWGLQIYHTTSTHAVDLAFYIFLRPGS